MHNKNLELIKKAFKETDLILIIDKEGKILYYNNYNDIHNKLGIEDVIGMHMLELYPWLTYETSAALTVLKTGQAIINQPQIAKLDDGTDVNSINTAFPLKNKDGIIGTVLLSYDINSISTSPPTMPKTAVLRKHNMGAKYVFDDIITRDSEMLGIIRKLKKAAKHDSNIFIYGETGTGKELFAHAIHNESKRSRMPFISQNCAAIPETLMESLIFGTTAGSFTGAIEKKGLFELANGGTVFLDEINSMPLSLQSKILRVVEDKRVRRIGGSAEFDVDVRIISSTNDPPEELVKDNRFRNDLFYRLSVVNVAIPPLRHRKDDILFLTQHFIDSFNTVFEESIQGIDKPVEQVFMRYSWPGNVREFKNCIESAFNSVTGNKITISDLPDYIRNDVEEDIKRTGPLVSNELSLQENTESVEKHLITEALKTTGGNIAKASVILGIPRQSVYNKIKKYNISIDEE